MALTRKMLAAMDIPAEKIDEIINAHTETVNAIKEERDQAKSEVKDLKDAEKQLEKANAELEELKSGDWQAKYEKLKDDNDKLKGEFEAFKTDTETKATKAAKESAYKQLLLDAGISDKRIASIMKVSDVDSVTLDDEGKIKDADKLTESVKTEWADFIVTEGKKGAGVSNPPDNNGGDISRPSRATELVAQYRNEHYGNPMKEE